MSVAVPRAFLRALVVAALAAVPVRAQQAPSDSASRPESRASGWERVSVSVRYGGFWLTADSELFALLDHALAPGSREVRPDLMGGALHVRVTDRWGLQFGIDVGESTVASASRVQPGSGAGAVRQQTRLELTAVPSLGAEWQALRWRGRGSNSTDRLRLVVGAGGGVASYRLRQHGDFVDAERRIAFPDDYRSAGRGSFSYASAGIEVPLRRWIALQGEMRHQVGSASMSADFAEFDRLDLGGTRVTAGLRIHPVDGRR